MKATSKKSTKFQPRNIVELAHAVATGEHIPQATQAQSVAERRATAKKTAMITPQGNVVVAASYAVDVIKEEWAKK
ncbi:MAG: hypothetical protein HGB03_02095 [Candidatus Yonathbacteria bacterium]|nr:hypothetical protein [Candidatus Yonathbacteria bacterium]NTW48046.1 hypothetical protein [Candidatus Yonathbacteria bacterium]